MTVVGIAQKVAVYNRHWSTGGGGEKFAAGIAAALAAEHDVMLIAHEAVDTAGSRSGCSWTSPAWVSTWSRGTPVRCRTRRRGTTSSSTRPTAVGTPTGREAASTSSTSRPVPGAVERVQAALAERASGVLDGGAAVTYGDGFYLPEHRCGPSSGLRATPR